MDDLMVVFKSKEIIKIFQRKGVEFPDISDICEVDYFESIDEAESYLERIE